MIPYENNSLKSGIYQIRNLINDKIYIGSSFRFNNRKYQHFKLLKLGIHDNKKLQNSVNKYGIDNFVFEILEICKIENLIEREQYYLDMYKSVDKGYNILRNAHNSYGYKHSEETKLKISEMQKGKQVLQSVKDMLLDYSKNRVVSKETRKKLSEIHLGKKLSEITKDKLRKLNSIEVEQYDLDGNLITTYPSIKEASKICGIAEQTIINSIKNRTNPKKYIWKKLKKQL